MSIRDSLGESLSTPVIREAAGISQERELQFAPSKRSQTMDVIAKPILVAQTSKPDCAKAEQQDCADGHVGGTTRATGSGWNYWYNRWFGGSTTSESTKAPLESGPKPGIPEAKPTIRETPLIEPHAAAPARPGFFGRSFGGHASAS